MYCLDSIELAQELAQIGEVYIPLHIEIEPDYIINYDDLDNLDYYYEMENDYDSI